MEINNGNLNMINETENLVEIDFKFQVEKLIKLKEEANKHFKINIDQGLKEYLRVLSLY